MPTWSFYRLDDGTFTGATFSSRSGAGLTEATPAGCGAHEGIFNANRQRLDLATGLVVFHQPAPPADDEWRTWAWNEEAGRYVATPTAAALARDARAERARLLAACDWVVARAAERGEAVPPEWAAYRQALRDVPAQPGFPAAIEWPPTPA